MTCRRVFAHDALTGFARFGRADRTDRRLSPAWSVITAALLLGVATCGTVSGAPPIASQPATSGTSQGSLRAAVDAGPAPTVPVGSSTALIKPDPRHTDAPPDPPGSRIQAPGPTRTPAGSTGPVLPASRPAYLSVPAIGISSPLIELGLNPDASVEVPSLDDPDSKPGWYRNSPTPGAVGPAIILGHVDSRRFGPGVFYALQDLRVGNTVEVTRADGTVAIFSVNDVHIVPKSDFPTLLVYGNLDYAGLRLITCGGEFDSNARSYESNVIVFARLVGSRSA
jgi:sortase (surface protein transpeptidase)